MKITVFSLFAFIFSVFVVTTASAEEMSVADILAKRASLSEAQVTVTGKVVKVNNGIMRRNFIHIQDDSGEDKVIFTSTQTANVGDKVTATGTVKLDTDFGMGYFYPTLVEQSTLTPAK